MHLQKQLRLFKFGTPCFLGALMITAAAAIPTFATLPLHKKPPVVELSGSCGGRLDGSSWTSSAIAGKVFTVFYIDPDESDLNEPFFSRLKAENFPAEKVQSVAIINMKATWLPGGVLSMLLKSKQKKYPHTLYLKDNCKKFTGAWGLRDHSSDILLFNQAGEVLFSFDGKLTGDQIGEVIDLVWKSLGGKGADAGK